MNQWTALGLCVALVALPALAYILRQFHHEQEGP